MTKYFDVQIEKDKALASDAGTETFKIPTNNQIVALYMRIRAKNGATNNDFDNIAEATVEQSITNIKVYSGSAIFKDYTGEICRKIATYRNGRVPDTLITGIAGGTHAGNDDPLLGWQQAMFPMDFCTRQDPLGNAHDTILPAPLYNNNLNLRLDYNFSISASAGFVTGGSNHLMDLYARCIAPDTKPLQSKRILTETKKIDYTTVASGDERFDLTKEPGNSLFLRQLFVDSYASTVAEGKAITDMVFGENGGNDISTRWGTLQAINAQDCRLNYEKVYYADPTDTSTVHKTRVPAAIGVATSIESTTTPWIAKSGDNLTVTTASGEKYLLLVKSPVLPGMAVFDFDTDGNQMNMQNCSVNDLELTLTNGTASNTVQIIEQHVAKAWGY